MNNIKIELKPLHLLAMKLSDLALSSDELRRADRSHEFVAELEKRVERGNLINLQIRGEQTSGKSLVGFTIAKFVNEVLLKIKMKVAQIDADQIDFIQNIRNLEIGNECRLIDEWNEMSTTGYNSSTNQALLTHFNEVQAQRFIHKVACSPEKIVDPTARIILEVLDKEVKQKFTRCLIYYVVHKEGIRIEQLLGYVDIDVSKTLNDRVYLAYRKRKFKKMEMMWEDKVIDSRSVDEAKIILAVVKKMTHLAKDCEIVQRDMIRNYIHIVQDDLIALSILGEEKLVSSIYGILMYLKNIARINKKVASMEKAIMKSVGTTRDFLENQVKTLEEARNDMLIQFSANVERNERIIKAFDEYGKLDEKKIKKGEKEHKGGKLK